jgi:transcriptional regulator with XRE-family HTH domain
MGIKKSKLIEQISKQIKESRTFLNLTQVELAQLAVVSLPTLQNIESGKSNPSLSIVLNLLEVLGLNLKMDTHPIDWNLLSINGIPLLLNSDIKLSSTESTIPNEFTRELRKALLLLKQGLLNVKSREVEAFIAYLWALRDHYISSYKKIVGEDIKLDSYINKNNINNLIKLRRIAIANIRSF